MHTMGKNSLTVDCSSNGNITVDWHVWCRLCAKEDTQGNVNVFFKDEIQSGTCSVTADSKDSEAPGNNVLNLVAAIKKFLWVDINKDDKLPKMLCPECFSLVTSLENFHERTEKVQQLFSALSDSTEDSIIDVNALRLKFGLPDEERVHVLMPHPSPEVHYFETKPRILELEEILLEGETTTVAKTATGSDITANPLEQQSPISIKKEKTSEECKTDHDDVFEDEYPFNEAYNSEQADGERDTLQEFEFDNILTSKPCNNLINVTSKNETKPPASIAQEDSSTTKDFNKADTINTRLCRKRKIANALNDGSSGCSKEKSTCIDSSIKSETSEEDKDAFITCSECPRRFKRIQNFRQHMKKTHLKETPIEQLPCTSCPRVFATEYQLKRHAKVHLSLKMKKIFPCSYCEKLFTTPTMVQAHVKNIHRNERPFICEECGVRIATNTALKDHMLTHTDYAPFKCDVCKKGFKSKIRLKNHMEIHDPNKHICAECGLQLNSRATLNRHLLVHSDKMQHKCDYCGRAFKRAKALKNHLILHTGLKPYSCDFCERTFANGSNCRSHKKKAHPEELAALEASGGGKTYTRNIPKLEALKAVTKTADNLAPVVSKQSGCFAFGKKPKGIPKSPDEKSAQNLGKQKSVGIDHSILTADSVSNSICAPSTQLDLSSLQTAVTNANLVSGSNSAICPIPNIDNLYNHIMKQATITVQNLNSIEAKVESIDSNVMPRHIKRPPSEAPSTYVNIEHDASSDLSSLQRQSQTQSQPQLSTQQQPHQLHLQQTQQNNSIAVSVAATTAQEFYSQIVKHREQQQQQNTHSQHQQHLIAQQQQRDEIVSIRSPDSQASLMTTADDHSNTSAHFYNHVRQNRPEPYI